MEHKPILSPGLHDLSEDDLSNHFLADFSTSKTRSQLINGLQAFLDLLKPTGIRFEIWIDGSFTTEKPDPSDVDLVAFASAGDLNSLPPKAQALLQLVFADRARTKRRFGCDVLFAVSENPEMRSYWRGWYGFDRNENPKGIARITLN